MGASLLGPGPARAGICGSALLCGPASIASLTVSPESTTATFAAAVNSGGGDFSYYFTYGSSVGFANGATRPQSVLGGYGTQTVAETVAGLTPNVPYLVTLHVTASNGAPSETVSFSTPPLPALPVTLSCDRTMVDGVCRGKLIARVLGADRWTQVALDYATNRSGPYRTQDLYAGSVDASGRAALLPRTDRNYWFQAHLIGVGDPDRSSEPYPRFRSVSNPVFVQTPPAGIEFVVTCGTFVLIAPHTCILTGDVGIRPLLHSRRRLTVFAYAGPTRGGPFRKVGTQPIDDAAAHNALYLRFPQQAADRHSEYFLICTQRPILPNVGPDFHFRACGRRRLGVRGAPAAAYYVQREL